MVHSDFEAQENKICHYFHFFPFYLPWSGPHTFVFWSLCFKRSLIWWILTTSNLPWFMDLTFQAPMQYCSLQTLLSPLNRYIAEHCFHFGTGTSFFLELLVTALHSSPVAYWTPSNLGGLIFLCHMFLPFYTVHGVLKARILKWVAISSSSRPWFFITFHYDTGPWMDLHGMAHSFIVFTSSFAMRRLWSIKGNHN